MLQILVHQRDRHTASRRRRHAFDRAQPHIPTRENTRDARFEDAGSRLCDQCPAFTTSSPVSTYPRASRAISAGSHPVSASARMKTRSPPQLSRCTDLFALLRISICQVTVAVDRLYLRTQLPPLCSISLGAARSGNRTCSIPGSPRITSVTLSCMVGKVQSRLAG